MQAGRLTPCFSVNGTDFTAGLAQNASQQADLLLPSEIGGIGTTAGSRLRSLLIWSSENLAWNLRFYGKHDARSADPNFDTLLGMWTFGTADAVQDQLTKLYLYYIDGLDIRITDQDQQGKLHVVLTNTSVAAKASYGAGSQFRLGVNLEAAWGG